MDDQIPFEIPKEWEWCRITNIATSQLGKTLDRGKDQGKEYPYLCSINVYWEGIDLSKVKTFKLQDDELERYRVNKGDLLICEGGDYSRCAVWERDDEIYYQNALHRVRFFCDISPYFFKYVVELYRQIGYIVGQGQTIKHFTYENMKGLLFPLPSVNEQNRIRKKIDEILPYLAKYSETYERESKLNYSIKRQLKKSILQEAIQGKLVEQNPDDEPASVLFERIREEKARLVKEKKIKRDKQESIIYRGDDNKYFEKRGKDVVCIDDEIPFEIPNSWSWCRIKDIFQINPKNEAQDDAEAAFIPMEKIDATYFSSFTYITKKWGDIKKGFTHFADGDVAFAKITPCFQNRKSMILKDLPNGIGAGTTELKVLRPYGNTIIKEFLLFFLESPYFVDEATFKGTANQQRIISGYLENKLFPLPPLKEQQRIVDAVLSSWQVL